MNYTLPISGEHWHQHSMYLVVNQNAAHCGERIWGEAHKAPIRGRQAAATRGVFDLERAPRYIDMLRAGSH